MKMSQGMYDTIRNAMRNIYNQRNVDLYNSFYADKPLARKIWDLFHEASFELRNDNDHPYFTRPDAKKKKNPMIRPIWAALNLIESDGRMKRINAHIPGFDPYNRDEDLNDAHIETALKKIAKELGIK